MSNDQTPAAAATQDQTTATQHDTSDFAPQPVAAEPVADNVSALPEKYRGKTVTEIVEMHRNAESELGRARNEIGTVRRLADELFGIRRADLVNPSPAKPERPKLTTDALFNDPDTAITNAIKADAEQRDWAMQERTARLENELLLNRFEKKHPDYQDVMKDQAFSEWVQKSPYRANLAQGALQGNFAAADELFSLYGESRPAATPAPTPTTRARQAGLVRGGGSTNAAAATSASSKKIWSRAELIQMRISDPDKFDSLYVSEIAPAYREKRVR